MRAGVHPFPPAPGRGAADARRANGDDGAGRPALRSSSPRPHVPQLLVYTPASRCFAPRTRCSSPGSHSFTYWCVAAAYVRNAPSIAVGGRAYHRGLHVDVISIGKVTSSGAAIEYFEEALEESKALPFEGLHQYLAGGGQSFGVWRGRAADDLGLSGAVQREHLLRILDAKHPFSEHQLATKHAESKNVAFDVTYSVPKSVSLLYALGDAPVRAAVLQALRAGADAAHEYLEEHAGWGRKFNAKTKGPEIIRAGLATAAFTHRTARPVTHDGITVVDPQLHVHLLVSSFVHRADGSWGQLYSVPLYAHAAAAGAIGQAVTRDSLVRLLGVRVRTNANGTFEVEGFTSEQLAEFSNRHRQLLAAAAAAGTTSLHGTKMAVLATREGKSEPDATPELVVLWRERAAAVGLSPDHIASLLDQEQVRHLRWIDVDTVEQIVGRGEGGLTADRSVFARRDVIRALAAHAPLGMKSEAIERLADAILAAPAVITPMVPPHQAGQSASEAMQAWTERGMEVHYSTPEVVDRERRTLESAERRADANIGVVPPSAVRSAIRASRARLTAGQREMVDTVCTSPAGVLVIEGAAGTGKTTAARVIRRAFEDRGVPVVGCALSGRATVGLRDQAGITSYTAASLIYQLTVMEGRLKPGTVVIADECSMMGPDLSTLVLLAERDSAKLALIGDSRQIQPIDGGGLFRSLGDRLGRVSLNEVLRQRESWDRTVLRALRYGNAKPLVSAYFEQGRIRECEDEAERIGAMAADWVALTRKRNDVIAVARERHVVAALNVVTRRQAVRAGLVKRGGVRRACVDHLGDKPVDLGVLQFAAGDRILLVGKNKRRQGLVKGVRGTVLRTERDGTLVVAPHDGGRELVVPPDYTGVTHGYALTAHRAVGATADIGLIHGSDSADNQWHYVALTRHRIRALYYDIELPRDIDGVHHDESDDEGRDERLLKVMSRDGTKATTLDYPREYARQLVAAHVIAADNRTERSVAPTEQQLAILRRRGQLDRLPENATWLHASLAIDALDGNDIGVTARAWLLERGTAPADADHIISLALHDLKAATHRPLAARAGHKAQPAARQHPRAAGPRPVGYTSADRQPPIDTSITRGL